MSFPKRVYGVKMEAGGFEPPSGRFPKSFQRRGLWVNPFRRQTLAHSHEYSLLIAFNQNLSPEILPYYSRENRPGSCHYMSRTHHSTAMVHSILCSLGRFWKRMPGHRHVLLAYGNWRRDRNGRAWMIGCFAGRTDGDSASVETGDRRTDPESAAPSAPNSKQATAIRPESRPIVTAHRSSIPGLTGLA